MLFQSTAEEEFHSFMEAEVVIHWDLDAKFSEQILEFNGKLVAGVSFFFQK